MNSPRRCVAALVLSIGASGCFDFEDRDCYCEGEELDFSVVGDLAGQWAEPGQQEPHFGFDSHHRIRLWFDREFGCAPGELPLIVGAETQRHAGFGARIWELVRGKTEPGTIDLVYFSDDSVYERLHFELDGDMLIFNLRLGDNPDVELSDVVSEYVRISTAPSPVPETPPCR